MNINYIYTALDTCWHGVFYNECSFYKRYATFLGAAPASGAKGVNNDEHDASNDDEGGSDDDGDDAVIGKKRLDMREGKLNQRLKAPRMIEISAAKRSVDSLKAMYSA